MATVKVRLKDASGNVLHPETDWSMVKNRPSITVDSNREAWDVSGSDMRLKANRIYIEDSAGGVNLLANYPIKYSAISGKPGYLVGESIMSFGYYSTLKKPKSETPFSTVQSTSKGPFIPLSYSIYPAVRIFHCDENSDGTINVNKSYYCFNGTSWITIKENEFIPGL